jgi:hypothetical protein
METRKKFNIRISEQERKAMQKMADRYCEGNFSEWLRLAAMSWAPNRIELEKAKETCGVK